MLFLRTVHTCIGPVPSRPCAVSARVRWLQWETHFVVIGNLFLFLFMMCRDSNNGKTGNQATTK